MVALSHYRISA